MASANYQTKLTADTSQHDQALSRSAKQVYDYKKSCESTDKGVGKLLGTFKKFAGALGGIKIAGDLFKKMMVENQEMADRYGATMEMAKTVTSEFAYSLSTFDFSNMYDGLGDLISRAKEYYDAMDALETFHIASAGINARDQKLLSDAYLAIREGRFEEGLKLLNEAEAAASDTAMHNYEKATDALDKFVAKIAYAKESVRKGGDVWGAIVGNQKWVAEASLSTSRVRDLIYDAAKGGHMLDNAISDAERHLREVRDATEEFNEGNGKWYNVARAEAELEVLNRVKSQLTDGDNLKMFSQLDAEIVNSERGLSDLQRTILRYRDLANKGLNGDNKPTTSHTVKVKTELEPPPPGSIAELEKVLADLKEKYNLATTDEGENGRNALKKKIEDAEEELKKLKGEMEDLPAGSLAQWENDLKTLQLQWRLATNDADRAKIQEGIDAIQAEIDRINGKVEVPVRPKTPKQELQELIDELRYQMAMADTPELQIKIGLQIDDLEQQMEELDEKLKTPSERIQEKVQKIQDEFEKMGNQCQDACGLISDALNAFANTGDEAANKTLKQAASIVSAFGSAIPKILALVSAQEAEAISGAVASGASLPFPYNIAAIASAVASVMSALAPIVSLMAQANSYATGGIIGGNSHVGDNNIARVNAGEMILNGTQQYRLFRLLNGSIGPQDNNMNGGNVTFHISGSDLVGVLSNNEKRNSRVR